MVYILKLINQFYFLTIAFNLAIPFCQLAHIKSGFAFDLAIPFCQLAHIKGIVYFAPLFLKVDLHSILLHFF